MKVLISSMLKLGKVIFLRSTTELINFKDLYINPTICFALAGFSRVNKLSYNQNYKWN